MTISADAAQPQERRTLRAGPPAQSPYLGLAPFGLAQAHLFFGRERDTRLVASNLLAFRMTVLYGPSGVGKSSLLRAAVLPEVARRVRSGPGDAAPLVVYVDGWRDDPTLVVDREVRAAAAEAGLELPDADGTDAPLRDRLERWATSLGRELYLIFDQFEEFFLYNDEPSGPATEAIGEALGADLPVAHVLISLREDGLAKLDRFEDFAPAILNNTYRLAHLDRGAATAAVAGPIEVLNRLDDPEPPWRLEDGLVDTVLDQVRVGDVVVGAAGEGQQGHSSADAYETAHLQLIMRKLWEAEQQGAAHELRIATLAALGGANGIVRSHLSETLRELTAREQDLAASAFVHLVTPSGSKIAQGVDDLAEYAAAPVDEVEAVMAKLASGDQRILRSVPPAPDRPEVARYEIFHDALGAAITEWRRSHQDRARVRRERRRGLLITAVAVVQAALLVASALFWLRSVGDRRDASSERLAALSQAEVGVDPQRATQLALDAWGESHTAAAEAAVRHAASGLRQTATYLGHTDAITALDVGPDGSGGTEVLTTSDDGTARVQAGGAASPITLSGDQGRVTRGALSPDGLLAATLGADGPAVLWDARTGKQIRTISDPKYAFTDVAFSPAGDRLALLPGCPINGCDAGSGLRVVDLAGPGQGTVVDASPFTTLMAFTSDGSLAVGRTDGSISVLDPATGQALATTTFPVQYLGYSGAAVALVGRPAGKTLALVDSQGQVYTWRWEDQESVPLGIGGGATASSVVTAVLEYSPDGTRLAAGIGTAAWLFDTGADGREQPPLPDTGVPPVQVVGPSDQVTALAYSEDSSLLVIGGAGGAGWAVDGRNGSLISELRGHERAITGAAVAADGTIFTASQDGTARRWASLDQTQLTGLVTYEEPITDAVYDIRNERVVATSPGGALGGWALDSATPSFVKYTSADRVAVDASGRWMAGAGRGNGTGAVYVWDLSDPNALRCEPPATGGFVDDSTSCAAFSLNAAFAVSAEAPLDSTVTDLAFTRREGELAIALSNGAVLLWRFESGGPTLAPIDPLVRLAQNSGDAVVAVSPAGGIVATSGEDGNVSIWDVESLRRVRTIHAHGDRVFDLTFSPDGSRLATGGGDRLAKVWDVATGNRLATLPVHSQRASAVAFNGDGTEVATGTNEGEIGIWDVQTARYRFLAPVHTGAVNALAYLPDGRLLSVGDDSTIRVSTCTTCVPIATMVEQLRATLARVDRQPTFRSRPSVGPGACVPSLVADPNLQEAVDPIPCDAPHAAEVYGVVYVPVRTSGDLPDTPAREAEIDAYCRSTFFDAYVGVPAESSVYRTSVVPLLKEPWQATKEVWCLLESESNSDSAARGSKR